MRFGFSSCETIADYCQKKVIPLLVRHHTRHLSCPDSCGQILPKDVSNFLAFLKQQRKVHISVSAHICYIHIPS